MSIWAAAGAILGVAAAAFASVFAKMVFKEVRDIRKGPRQLPLRMDEKSKQHEREDEHAQVGV